MSLTAFADSESLLVAWLAATFTPDRFGVDTPDNLETLPVFTQVRRIGGPVVGVRLETVRVDVRTFAPTRATASSSARATQAALLHAAPGQTVTAPSDGSVGVITRTVCETGPSWLPYSDTAVVLMGATYGITLQTA